MPSAIFSLEVIGPILTAQYYLCGSVLSCYLLRIIKEKRPIGPVRPIVAALVPRQVSVLMKHLISQRAFMNEIMWMNCVAFTKDTF